MRSRRITQNVAEILVVCQQDQGSLDCELYQIRVRSVLRRDVLEADYFVSRRSQQPHGSAENAVVGKNQAIQTSSTTWMSSFCTRSRANSRQARMSSSVRSGK